MLALAIKGVERGRRRGHSGARGLRGRRDCTSRRNLRPERSAPARGRKSLHSYMRGPPEELRDDVAWDLWRRRKRSARRVRLRAGRRWLRARGPGP